MVFTIYGYGGHLEFRIMTFLAKGQGSIRGYFGLTILEKLNTFVNLVCLHNLNVTTCF